MKIVVSGGTGMIARALLSLAVEEGHEAFALVRPDSSRLSALPAGVKTLFCDLSDYHAFSPKERADVFFHLAWAKTSVAGRDDVAVQEKNIAYTLDAAALAARMGCTCFVGAGSQAEYGRKSGEKLGSFTSAEPESGYGIAKYAAGKLSYLACDKAGVRHCWTRILSVFGEHDAPTTLISYLRDCFVRGETPQLTPCEQVWDYLYCKDAARALLAVGLSGKHGKTYPIGSGVGRRLSEYVEEMRDILAPGAPVAFGAKAYYPHQPMYMVADLSELTLDTGFTPAYTFAQGISAAYGADRR